MDEADNSDGSDGADSVESGGGSGKLDGVDFSAALSALAAAAALVQEEEAAEAAATICAQLLADGLAPAFAAELQSSLSPARRIRTLPSFGPHGSRSGGDRIQQAYHNPHKQGRYCRSPSPEAATMHCCLDM